MKALPILIENSSLYEILIMDVIDKPFPEDVYFPENNEHSQPAGRYRLIQELRRNRKSKRFGR